MQLDLTCDDGPRNNNMPSETQMAKAEDDFFKNFEAPKTEESVESGKFVNTKKSNSLKDY